MTAVAANTVENIINDKGRHYGKNNSYSNGNGNSKNRSPSTNNPPSLPALRSLMQEHVGLLRNRQGLTFALRTLDDWREQIRQLLCTQEQASLSLQLDAAWLLTQAALARPHSLGAHFRVD